MCTCNTLTGECITGAQNPNSWKLSLTLYLSQWKTLLFQNSFKWSIKGQYNGITLEQTIRIFIGGGGWVELLAIQYFVWYFVIFWVVCPKGLNIFFYFVSTVHTIVFMLYSINDLQIPRESLSIISPCQLSGTTMYQVLTGQ